MAARAGDSAVESAFAAAKLAFELGEQVRSKPASPPRPWRERARWRNVDVHRNWEARSGHRRAV